MLKEFGREIWTADGPDVSVVGFHYPTRMAVMRSSDGSLFVWSPIRLTDRLRAAVDAAGQVRHIVAPNSLHHLIQQFPVDAFSGWRAVVATLDLMTEPEPSVPRKFRVAFTNPRRA